VQAPAPARPIEGGLPTAALLAHVAAAKFAWRLPLNRQAQRLAGHGIDLDRERRRSPTPSASSRSLMRLLTTDFDRPNWAAAAVIPPASTTRKNVIMSSKRHLIVR
jgi:transposase